MPMLYLSPSTQEGNFYVSGNTEEYYMNLLADAMEPWLRSSGISFTRNTPDMTAVSSIAASNAGNYKLHLALHSNASPEASYGQTRGSIALRKGAGSFWVRKTRTSWLPFTISSGRFGK